MTVLRFAGRQLRATGCEMAVLVNSFGRAFSACAPDISGARGLPEAPTAGGAVGHGRGASPENNNGAASSWPGARPARGISTWSGNNNATGKREDAPAAEAGDDPLQVVTSSSFLELLETSTHGFWHALSKRRPVPSDFASIREEYSWTFLEENGFESYEIESMQYRCPGLLELSVESSMEPALMYLRSLRLQPGALHAMIFDFPRLLTLDAADEMEPVVAALTAAGLSRDELPLLLQESPRFLVGGPLGIGGLRVAVHERLALGWQDAGELLREAMLLRRSPGELVAVLELLGLLGLGPETLGPLALDQPRILARPPADIEDRVRLLERHGLTRADVGRVIAFAPALLLGSSSAAFESRAGMVARLARLSSGWLPAESCPPSWRTYWGNLFRAPPRATAEP